KFAVLIPLVTVRALDEAHAAFGQAPRQYALPCEVLRDWIIQAVELLRRFGFFFNLKSFRRLALHTKGEFKGLDARFELRVILPQGLWVGVDVLQQVEFKPLLIRRVAFVAEIFNRLAFDVVHLQTRVADGRALISAGQKSR